MSLTRRSLLGLLPLAPAALRPALSMRTPADITGMSVSEVYRFYQIPRVGPELVKVTFITDRDHTPAAG